MDTDVPYLIQAKVLNAHGSVFEWRYRSNLRVAAPWTRGDVMDWPPYVREVGESFLEFAMHWCQHLHWAFDVREMNWQPD
jgi:hypothetical protein